MATKFISFSDGNDANDCSSFANRGKTITSGFTAPRIAPGDELRIMKSPAPLRVQDSSGSDLNATFTNKSPTVTLSAAATKTIYLDGAWTAATGDVTCTTSATRKEGSNSSSIAIAAAFGTGKAAYFALAGGAQDLSGYSKVTFHIRTSTVIAAGTLRIDLCSDAAGATPVNSLTINEATTSNVWIPFTLDNGGALGSSIQSIALYCISDPATVTVLIDDVLAANRLTLTSLIGKESAEVAYEIYPIQSINGTTVLLDYNGNNGIVVTRGYYGTTETVAIYSREPVAITSAQTPNEAGTAGNINQYKGGYDTTNMTSQDGITVIDCRLGTFNGLNIANTNANYSSFDKLIFVRGNAGISIAGAAIKSLRFTNIGTSGCSALGLSLSANAAMAGISIKTCYFIATNGTGLTLIGGSIFGNDIHCLGNQLNGISIGAGCRTSFIQKAESCNNVGSGLSDANFGGSITIYNLICKDNSSYGVASSNGGLHNIRRLTTSGNTSAGVNLTNGSIINIDNTDISESTKIATDTNSWTRANVSNYEGSAIDYRVFGNNTTLIQHDATVENTSGKGSSKHSPSTDFDTDLPLIQKFGVVVVNSGSQTHSIYMSRSNSAGTGRFVLRGGQIAGVDSDVTVSTSGATDTFFKYDLTFNPTESGVPIEFEFQSFGTGNIYFADYVAP